MSNKILLVVYRNNTKTISSLLKIDSLHIITMNNTKYVLITGVAGFIGHHTAVRLLDEGYDVVGIDNMAKDVSYAFKQKRIAALNQNHKFIFKNVDIRDKKEVDQLFHQYAFLFIIHLAARTGVRQSGIEYEDYISTNILGSCHLLEANKYQRSPFIFASSSSVYGNNALLPFGENQVINSPLSVYAATKASLELLAYQYAIKYKYAVQGLRFFTVYGPWARPDMATYLFFEHIFTGKEIVLYNKGALLRDFTYVEDTVECILRYARKMFGSSNSSNFDVANVGFGTQITVLEMVEKIEKSLDIKAKIIFEDKVIEDMDATHADITKLINDVAYKPKVDFSEGILRTKDWFVDYMSSK